MDIRKIVSESHRPAWHDANMPRDTYRGMARINPSALAAGLIGLGQIDTLAIKQTWESPDSTKRTAAQQDRLDSGTLAHLAILQTELLVEKIAIWTGKIRAGAEWDAFQDEHADKLIVRSSDYAETMAAVKAVQHEPLVSETVRGIQAELCLFATETVNGNQHLNVKGQVDGINFNKRIIIDLKTTEHGIDSRSVERTIRQFHNREKMALYRRWAAMASGTNADEWRCYNLFVLMTPPYGVNLVKFTTGAMEWGEERMLDALSEVGQRLTADDWPIFANEMVMSVEQYELQDEDVVISYE